MRGQSLAALVAIGMVAGSWQGAAAQQVSGSPAQPPTTPAANAGCTGPVDPYTNYACLDKYLGDDVATRFYNYYKLEWGKSGPPTDPNAPSLRRDGWPATPETTPPMPFTEWPYGGTTSIGVTQPGSVDSPLMAAIGNTGLGQWMNDNHFQLYGWVDPGANVSSNSVRPGGNAPVAYSYTPNTVQLDQTVVYLDRFPDTVQTDHVDWGMRLSAIYGENYRYTQSDAPFTAAQFQQHNNVNGYDFPMVYGELYIPQVAQGLMIRAGRYISIPDIEAQLAPNNYMYSHSLTYSYDNYTNEGIQGTLALTKQLMVQLGVNIGTESYVGNWGSRTGNPLSTIPGSEASALGLGSKAITNPLYGGSTYPKDPGTVPSLSACLRYTWNDGNDTIYPCADAINGGQWGYNNVQWLGTTFYHKFNEQWHVSFETYDIYAEGVPNQNNAEVQFINANGGTPFANGKFNQPNEAQCSNSSVVRCRASAIGVVAYLNYSPDPLDNFSFRPEFYDDEQGWRTGVKSTYYEFTLGWQHWLSPQIEFRPELGYYRSIDAKAFNGNTVAGIAPDKNYTVICQSDVIIHF